MTLNDLESHVVRSVSSTSIHTTIVHMASLSLIMNGRTEGHIGKCKFWGHVARERSKNSKLWLYNTQLLSHGNVCNNQIQPSYRDGERDFCEFKGFVSLTLDDLEVRLIRLIDLHPYHYIVHMASLSVIVNGEMDGHSKKCKSWEHVARERGKN